MSAASKSSKGISAQAASVVEGQVALELSVNVIAILNIDTVLQTFDSTFCMRAWATNAAELRTTNGMHGSCSSPAHHPARTLSRSPSARFQLA